MNSTVVESSVLTTVAYDEVRKLLRLEFRTLTIYQYFGVPAALHQALLQASSKGSYFNQVIRGYFPYSRVAKAETEVPHQVGRRER
jgi:KTSC domain